MGLNYIRGLKTMFRKVIGSGSSSLLCPTTDKIGLLLFNEGPAGMRIGNQSGTPTYTLGMLLPSGTFFLDDWSDDDWWGCPIGSSSGTVSGYYVIGQ